MKKDKIDLKKSRIRAFFYTLETIESDSDNINEIYDQISKEGMIYIQMHLPVEKITPEFEQALKNKIEQKIISAQIREASKEDLDCLRKLYNKAWLTTNTPFRTIDIDSLEKIFNDPDTIFLIARVYGMDAGFSILDFEGDNKEIGVIAGLGVLPRYQRRGLGTILGIASWDYFKEKGVKELRCEVYRDNEVSKAFINWIGFKEYGEKSYRKEDFSISD